MAASSSSRDDPLGTDDPASSASPSSYSGLEMLKRAWRNEKAAPEILQYEEELVETFHEQVRSREDIIDNYSGGGTEDLMLSLFRMDLDRTLFILRSYLRIRLQKIEKHVLHICKSDLWNRLSKPEQNFATRCTDVLEKHLEQSVLRKLPYGYQSILKQSISSEDIDMVPEPRLDTFVFCKSRDSIGSFQLDDYGEEIVDLVADDLYILRYKSIKALVESGRIDLL
ncbi:unnamed protein product [Victoria cruziana]